MSDIKLMIRNIKLNIDKCEIETTPTHGCYKCMKGAVTHVDWLPNIENAMVNMVCNSQSSTIFYTETENRNEIHFYSNTAQFHEVCQAARCETHQIFTIWILHFIHETCPITSL